jgi:hypothetical protein
MQHKKKEITRALNFYLSLLGLFFTNLKINISKEKILEEAR